jgi:hypothetical protein
MENQVPPEVLLAQAVSKWADTVTWVLLAYMSHVPSHLRSTLQEEYVRIKELAATVSANGESKSPVPVTAASEAGEGKGATT